MKILITDPVDPLFIKLLNTHNIDYEYNIKDSQIMLLKKINLFDGIVVRNRLQINTNFLQQAKKLKFIARYGSGMESINTKKAEELGIICFNSAAGNANSVAEHALGMLLCLFHNIKKSMIELNNSIWNRETNRGLEIEGKTIGIIGFGNTGMAFSKKLENFNCQIIAYDKFKQGFGNNLIQEVSMKDIYNDCDVISFHIPLNSKTRHLFNQDFIKKMKKPFYVLNTSRGEIVSNKDLIQGLNTNHILGAGLDVIENENSSFNKINFDKNFNYLLNCNNVILTPHIAGLSKEANKKLATILINKILALK